jgi:hypothetical protein
VHEEAARSGVASLRDRAAASAPAGVLGLGLVVEVVVLVHHAHRLWFFGDDFEFLLGRSSGVAGARGLLDPHNEHWSTLPVLAYKVMFELFGLRHYVPYALMPIAAHVVICVLMYLLLRRVGVAAWVASWSVVALAFLSGGAGAENTLWDFQVGFLGSCAFGVLALLVLTSDRRLSPILAVGAMIASLMCSGIGLIMVVWVSFSVLFRRGLRPAVLIAAVPVVVYLAWLVTFGTTHAPGTPDPVLESAPAIAALGLTNVWSAALGVPGAGVVVLVALVVVVLRADHFRADVQLAASGLVTAAAAFALFGYSRSGLGQDAAGASRYVYIGLVLMVPAVALGCAWLVERVPRDGWLLRISVAGTLVAVAAVGVAETGRFARERQGLIGDMPGRMVAAAQLAAQGAPLLRSTPDPTFNPDVVVPLLIEPSIERELPQLSPGPRAVLDTRVNLQVAAQAAPFELPAAQAVTYSDFLDARPAEPLGVAGGCLDRPVAVRSRIDVPVGVDGAQLRITLRRSSTLQAILVDGRTRSVSLPIQVAAGRPLFIGTTAGGTTLRISVPRGKVQVCFGTSLSGPRK